VDPRLEATESSAVTEALEHIDATRRRVASRSLVREVIFGTQDGLLTTLGLVSGVGGATSDRYSVLVAGLAGSIAGMIAMGAGAYIASKSQLEVHQAEVEREKRELSNFPERELEELVHLYQDQGLSESDARLVASKIATRPAAMLNAMTQMELGLQLEASVPLREGFIMALAFLAGAVVPMAPWFFASMRPVAHVAGATITTAAAWSAAATVVALFVMGIGKARLAHSSLARGATEVTAIGVAAAVFAYLLGSLFPHFFGVHTA
jgi:VIT1/CCC1 family predicted Fe2+/Mn2+ transporter